MDPAVLCELASHEDLNRAIHIAPKLLQQRTGTRNFAPYPAKGELQSLLSIQDVSLLYWKGVWVCQLPRGDPGVAAGLVDSLSIQGDPKKGD